MVITFLGHSKIYNRIGLDKSIEQAISENVCKSENVTFYCGGYGDFDRLSAFVCKNFKASQQECETVYVTPYMLNGSKSRTVEIMELYDSIVYPPLEGVPPRFAILKRNEWMIEKADLIIAYVNVEYGGAYRGLCYARGRGKRVINLAI